MNLKLRLVALLLVVIMCLSSCDLFNFIGGSDPTTTESTTTTTTKKSTTLKSTTPKSTSSTTTLPKLPESSFDPSSNSVSKASLVAQYTLTQEEVDATKAILDSMVTLSMDPDANTDDMDALYEEFETKFYHIAQQMTISMIIYYYNMADEESSERYLATQEMFYDVQDTYNQALKTMYLESPHKDELFEGWSEEELKELEDYDPAIVQLKKDIDALQVQYDQLTGSEADYDDICVEIYKQLVVKNNQLARLNKYDNYYDYASVNVYGRDYNKEKLTSFRDYVVKYVVPYVMSLLSEYKSYSKWDSTSKKSRVEEFLNDKFYTSTKRNYVSAYLNSLGDTTMGNSMRDVFESKNCIFSIEKQSHRTAFQTYLYEDDNPFCFFGSNGQSANTVIHEIGHYYAALVNHEIDNYDLCETHSQGNEFLFLTYCQPYMNADVYNIVEAYSLVNACYIMVLATIIDEFEQRIYALDDETISAMTSDEIDAIMTSVCEPYGGAYWVGNLSDPYAYWRLVCISNPVYYISYAVSASASINIYALAQEDYDAAILAYTALVEGVSAEDGFLKVLTNAGFTTPFEEETFVNIAGILSK